MKKKRVLLVTQYFYPENFKSNDIAFELVKRGYEVDALVGIPNYPVGRYCNGYGIFRKRIETIQGVNVYRAFQTPRGRKAGGVGLALNYLSFAFFASFWAVWLSVIKRYDYVFVHQTSPITQAIPAIIVKKLQHIPMYTWVLDLWPESLIAAGGVHNKYILKCFDMIVRCVYRNSHKILVSSKRFTESIVSRSNIFASKIIYFPNWDNSVSPFSAIQSAPSLPNARFRIVFAGNIGEAQDFESTMQAVLLLKNRTDIKWIFIGDGRKRKWIEDFVQFNHLEKTVVFMGNFSKELIPSLLTQADLLYLALKDAPIFSLTVPAKMQTYMSVGKPILAMINGETQDLIQDAQCGYSVNAGDFQALASRLENIVANEMDKLDELGINGKMFFQSHFTMDICINNLCKLLT